MAELEKVIEHLKEIAEYFRGCRSNASFASKAENHFWELQNAASEAAELLKAQEPGWISVKDKLPDRSGYYLCYKPNAGVDGLKIDVHRWRSIDGDWAGSEVGSRIIGITHWMPLPEPPNGG